jgi:hypothetical protein
MLNQMARNAAYLGFVLEQATFGTRAALLTKVLPFRRVLWGVVLSEYSAYVAEVVLRLRFPARRPEDLLRLKSRKPTGDPL